jgi:hypothetical protein
LPTNFQKFKCHICICVGVCVSIYELSSFWSGHIDKKWGKLEGIFIDYFVLDKNVDVWVFPIIHLKGRFKGYVVFLFFLCFFFQFMSFKGDIYYHTSQ